MPNILLHSLRRILGVCKVKIPFCSPFIMKQADQTPAFAIFGGPFEGRRSMPISVADFGVIVPITERFGFRLIASWPARPSRQTRVGSMAFLSRA
jgi:hypothetical protein